MDGNAVIYPKLQYLEPSFDYNDPIERVLAPDIVPFPVLQCLRLFSRYPFGDDVMFRGNSATLEKLSICLDAEDIAILMCNPVFNGEFRNLRTLYIDNGFGRNNLTQVPMPTMHKFIRNVAANARKVSLTSNIPLSGLIDLTSSGCRFESIQFLDMRSKKSSLHDILRLLNALPVLAKLFCDIDDLDSGFKLLTDDDLPDHVASNFGNAGNHLHTWLLPHAGGERSMKVADYVMLLAIACPRL
ncbi:hypothetical protein GGI16_009639, partial [Coemansia sp. S142-1]